MKHLVFLFLLTLLFSCKKDTPVEHNTLVGKWKLVASLADPGDGSGTWHKASHPSYLEFTSDGRLIYSPPGTFDADHYVVLSDSTLDWIRGSSHFPARYIFTKSFLTIYPSCIEACGEKYEAVVN